MQRIRKIRSYLWVFVGLAVLGNRSASGMEVVKGDHSGLDVLGTAQMLGVGNYVDGEQVKKSTRMYVFMPQARLGLSGHLGDYKFFTQLGLGGEAMPNSTNANFLLLDMQFDVPVAETSYLRVGQFKTPYGSEFLTPDNARLFTELSIANYGANLGRDIGLALVAKSSSVNGTVGLFTGGGMDTSVLPLRILPEDFGVPLLAARIGYDNTGGDALSHQQAGVFKIDDSQVATYVQGFYELDSRIGHSSVMNLAAGHATIVYQQNLLLNPNWNPYLTLNDKASLYGLGLNGLYRTMLGNSVFTAEGALDWNGFSSNLGTVSLVTARVQASAANKPWEFALRVAMLNPDSQMGPTIGGTAYKGLIGSSPFYEVTPAVTYYLKDWSKLMLEVQNLVNVPVSFEPGDGSYILSEQPSQVTYTSGTKTLPNTITRQFVPEIKLMWQIAI